LSDEFDTPEHAEKRRQCQERGHQWTRGGGAPVIEGGLISCKRCGKFVRTIEEAMQHGSQH